MNTYPICDIDGRVYAFEIENVYIKVKKVANILLSAQGVSDIRIRKLFSTDGDIHVEFTYKDKKFIVWEPYADSSRYWIGPKDEADIHIEVSALEGVFHQYRPPLVIKILGDLVSFKVLSTFRRRLTK